MFDSDYEKARFHYTQGNHYWHQNGGLAASIEHFQVAVDLMPEEAGLRYTLGFALHQAKRNEEALHHFTMAYSLDQTLHKAECLMAEVLLDLDRYDLAERHYQHFVAQSMEDSDRSHGYYGLGLLAYKVEDWGKAAGLLRRAVELHPPHLTARHYLSGALSKQERYEEALAELQTCVELDPFYADGYHAMGYVYKSLKQMELARHAWEKVLEIGSDKIADNARRALETLSAVARSDAQSEEPTPSDDSGVWHYNNGFHCWKQEHDLATAVTHFEKAVALSPDKAEWQYTLGFTLHKAQRDEEAVLPLKTALSLDPSMTKAEFILGEVFCALQRYDEAEKRYAELIRLNRDDATVAGGYYGLGLLAYKAKCWERAASLLSHSISLYPYNATVHYYMGITLKTQGKFEAALAELKASLKIEPRRAESHLVLGNIYNAMERLDAAREAWQKAVELGSEAIAAQAKRALERYAA